MRFLFRAILLLAAAASLPASAQVAPPVDPATQIVRAETELRTIDRVLDTRLSSDERSDLRARAVAAQQAAKSSASQLDDQLALVDARIAGLGPVAEGVTEAPEIQQQRKRLASERAIVDAAIKRGRLADVEAQQLIDEMDRSQAEQLNETLTTRIDSPLAPTFWGDLLGAFPRDLRKVDLFLSQGVDQIARHWHGGLPWQALLGMVLAFLLLFPLRLAARKLGQRHLIGSAPGHRIRRSVFALWRIVVGTIAPLLAATALMQGFRWAGLFPERWSDLTGGFVAATGFAAFTASLTGALLMRGQASWRIVPISDETAAKIRPLTWILAGIAFSSILVESFNKSLDVSRATIGAWQMAEALLHLLWIGAFLMVLGRMRAARAAREEQDQPTGAGLAMVTLVTWALVILALLALALGYVSLSLFTARIVIWLGMVGGALYLLLGTADDAATLLFSRDSRLGVALVRSVGLRGSLVDQFGVLVSGVLRLTLVLLALALMMQPFGGGEDIGSVFGRFATAAQGIDIGGVAISPGAILRAIVVLTIGLALVRAFMSWLEKRYLPATDLDGSAQNSASLVARYVGIALAIIWALASLGIGVERIALLLSALSVGIGFGLQAITQNFVSGLILLAERPIKIGDWVRVGTDEGDVKRISVRSTEITLADHSTLIVPNSELITKSVLNKTLSSPLGRIQIQFSVTLGADIDTVLGIVLGTFAGESAVIETPAPAAYIDSITDGRVFFNCFAHVGSPREVYRARSRIFIELLRRFAKAGIDIGTAAQRLELAPGEHLSFTPPEASNPAA